MSVSGHTVSERILVFPFDLLSHYLRCIELAKRYPGAEIFFASSAKYSSFVHQSGYRTFHVEHFDAGAVMNCAEKFSFAWLNQKDIERVFLSQVKAIHELKPGLVIGDTSPALKMAAEHAKVPYVALMNAYMSRYYSELRTLPQTRPVYVLLSRLPAGLIRFGEKISFRLVHQPFRRLRRKYGLKPVADYLREMEGDETLLCDEAYLFPQKKLPESYRIIGPLIYDNGQPEEELLSLFPPGKKVILICMGSSGNWEALRFLCLPRYSAFTIVTAGDDKRVIQADHVIARPFISLSRVLPHCALLICHGGNGTIYHGIRHKVPMLCLTSHFEQEWNAQRLQALRLGTWINPAPKAMVDRCLELL